MTDAAAGAPDLSPDHLAAVVELAAAAQPPTPGGSTIIAIDGLSGSGKTTLATAVARELGSPVLHMDEFYPGWDGLAAGVRRLTELVLQPFCRGEPAVYRPWDWHRDGWGQTVTVPWAPVLVVEGCGATARPADAYAAVRVWVKAGAGVRRRRALARDGAAYEPHWQRWADQEEALFARDRTRERAHLVLDTSSA